MGRSYKRDNRGRFAGGAALSAGHPTGAAASHSALTKGSVRSNARLNRREAALAKAAKATMPVKGKPVSDSTTVLRSMLKRGHINRQRVAIGARTGKKVAD
jgi:hypothetical protein